MTGPVRSIKDAPLRFGDWGPGYLVQDADAAFGAVVLRPGDEFANHLHEHHTESFLVVEGALELWLDRAERLELAAGDLVRCRPGVEHCLRNTGAEPATALFIKTPWVDADKVDRPWSPPSQAEPATASRA